MSRYLRVLVPRFTKGEKTVQGGKEVKTTAGLSMIQLFCYGKSHDHIHARYDRQQFIIRDTTNQCYIHPKSTKNLTRTELKVRHRKASALNKKTELKKKKQTREQQTQAKTYTSQHDCRAYIHINKTVFRKIL